MSAPRPMRVGPYTLGPSLGEGGMGRVYRARTEAGAEMALKLIRASLTSDDALRRFEREAAVRIEHPNVVQVLDAGMSTEGPYIAFELLEGATLAERLVDRPFTLEQTVDIGVQACRGLIAAHDAGVVHRDIKPSNLFLCADGVVKILDFGVARLDAVGTRLTATGQVVGTLAYLSPEQAERRVAIDHRTDLWSLGAVLYECLAGRPPFMEDTPLATVVAVMLGQPPPITSLASGVGPEMERALARALEKNPADRFADARQMLAAIEGVQAHSGEITVSVPATLRPDERRAIVLLYATGVRDEAAVAAVVREEGGLPLTLAGQRAIGLFGGDGGTGDDAVRAATAAVKARGWVDAVAVSAGHATGATTGITGPAVEAAERAIAFDVDGVAITAEAARDLPELRELLTQRDPACFELSADASVLERLRLEPGSPPLVGRELELAQLHQALAVVAEEGRAQRIWILGPPGMGKSRLAREACRDLEERVAGARLLTARLDPVSAGRELCLWVALARAAADRDSSAGALAELAYEPGTERHARLADTLRLLLGIGARTQVQPNAPTEIQVIDDRLRVAITDWILGAAERGPLVLLLEDVHRADSRSLELLDDLMDRAHDLPLLVLATARPEIVEAHPEALREPASTRLSLQGLRRGPATRLVEVCAVRPLPDALVERLVERSEGNPFFIEHFVRALSSSAPDEELPLPVSVESAVQSRLDALAPWERELCKSASVFDRPFTVPELEGLGAADAPRGARALRRRGLWAVRGAERLDFVSGLVRDVAHRLLVDERRAALHERAARMLEAGERRDAAEVASHWEAAGEPARAAQMYATAAVEAGWRGDAETILRASDAAMRLEPSSGARFDLRVARAEALRFRGSREAQREELEEALSAASTAADRARILSELCVWQSRTGDTEGAIRVGEAAASEAQRSGRAATSTLALGRLFLARLARGDLEEARVGLEQTRRAAAGVDEPRIQAHLAEWEGQLAAAEGDLSGRLLAFERAADLHRQTGDLRRAAGADANRADVLNRVGSYDAAETALGAAVDACRRVGHRTMEGYARLNLAYALIHTERAERALVELRAANALAERIVEPRLAILVDTYMAKAHLALGAVDLARSAAERARAAAVDRGFAALEIGARVERARAELAAGHAEAAFEATSDAMRRLTQLGGVEEDELLLYLTHAEAAEACGDGALAAQTRAAGAARLAALAAAIADPELRRGFEHDVAAHRALRPDT